MGLRNGASREPSFGADVGGVSVMGFLAFSPPREKVSAKLTDEGASPQLRRQPAWGNRPLIRRTSPATFSLEGRRIGERALSPAYQRRAGSGRRGTFRPWPGSRTSRRFP